MHACVHYEKDCKENQSSIWYCTMIILDRGTHNIKHVHIDCTTNFCTFDLI